MHSCHQSRIFAAALRLAHSVAPWTAVAVASLALAAASCGRATGQDNGRPDGSATSNDAGGLGGGSGTDGGACSDHAQGCACSSIGATVACWTGAPGDRGTGMCKDGTQTCQGQGEFSGIWGPCEGEVLTCGTTGGGAASSECGQVALGGDGSICRLTSTGGVKCQSPAAGIQPAPGDFAGIPAPPMLSDTRCIGGGEAFLCALSTTGAVRCWGQLNYKGGDPVSGDAPIAGLESGVAELAVGEEHACARMTTGAVKCFGHSGEVNSTPDGVSFSLTPTDVVGLGPDVKAIASGDGFSCALLASGSVQCWGNNTAGELGNGTKTASATPVNVIGLPAPAVAISASGASTACALLQTHKVMCWGNAADPPPGFVAGKFEDGHMLPPALTPVEVSGFAADVVALTTGGENGSVCALLQSGGVQCRGLGYLGDGHDFEVSAAAVGVVGMATATEVKSNDATTCARLTNGSVQCWGGLYVSGTAPQGLSCTTYPGFPTYCTALVPYDIGL